ncbi:PREDICTED: calcium homeostasis endoplasmic reticulum protein isoform X2 [Nicrophorus vespilloides]|uniref:Calcium homeostasis endoplasmic reticulum protein isoform X2 n=1 Tax=Nicrophorus vespilloides TaxID=110193 RepID=A0ABM1MB70_NICVS|nr:PREDICTED: calcium homeostasis endoplasmic reticulum protein isoform X2 [Nicrophorus vespilloides]XP_017771822.1 PREDICTED: calcium homeostasis endoplasmic reticulum protein isoform X2 [Nicrophorus vespilloides]
MDLPQPPQDTELRNIIDKLAQFVARNGPDFEQMTKNKQKGNPKFQFLYGGDLFNYYQYKVNTEQTILKQQGIWSSNGQNGNGASTSVLPPPPVGEMAQIKTQIDVLQEQIKQSEQNLNAQHAVLLQQQQTQVDVLLNECEMKLNQKEAEELSIPLVELNQLLTPITENCTKDSIQSGKSWILQNANTKEKAHCIANCLLIKVLQGTPTFNHRLHVIYLVNDVLHHCARKNAADVKDALESVVVAMFCSANLTATNDEQKNKLDKLLQLWESKANYLAGTTVEAMKRPQESLQTHKANQLTKFSNEIGLLTQQTQVSFESYRAQHQAFVMHATQQIQEHEARINLIDEQMRAAEEQQAVRIEEPPPVVPPINPSIPPPQFSQPPPGFFPAPAPAFPDFSKPPPGFPLVAEPTPEELLPSVPYYELPAGLMVPLIKLEDTNFKPLDPKDIRLPPPAPPNERLLAAVEAFYALPSHERPRDSEGWEKLGLYEYYKAKNLAKKEKDEQIDGGLREPSRSPSPVIIVQEKSPSPPRRRYTSKSPTPPSVKKSRSRSRSKSRSRSPPPRRSRRSSRRRRTRSRSRSRSPSSPTPSYSGRGMQQAPPPITSIAMQESLDSSNKGHQMLKKMGWGGSGLGVNEQGIDSPISGGDVRDKQDQFKGIGCNLNDPYENFRKNKGAAFITRMKARAEERAQEKQAKDDY